jgi:hypothetical protein
LALSTPTEDDLKANKEYMKKALQRSNASNASAPTYATDKFDEDESSSDEDNTFAFSTLTKTQVPSDSSSSQVFLDSAASQSIFKSLDLLALITPITNSPRVKGVEKGSKGVSVTARGTFLDLGRVNYSANVRANLLSLSCLVDQGCVVTYNQPNDFYLVTGTTGIVHCFSRTTTHTNGGMVKATFYSLDKDQAEELVAIVSTVAENSRRYTERELKQVTAAQELMRRLGHVPPAEAISILKSGINNTTVSPVDITNATSIHGHPIAVIKGSTRKKPSKLVDSVLPPRVAQTEQTLHLDLMFVKQEAFLVAVSTPLDLTLCGSLKDKSITSVHRVIMYFLSQLSSRNYTTVQVRVDGEGALASLADELQRNYQLLVHRSSSGEHVPVVERKIQTIKNSVRSHEHSLPFVLCRVFIVYLVLFCVSRLNLRTTRHYADKTSPWEQFSGMRLDAKRDLRVGFGDYLQCTTPTGDNSMKSRTDGCIALLPMSNNSGSSVKVYVIRTQSIVSRDHFRVLPMPTELIALLDQRARAQGYSRGSTDTIPAASPSRPGAGSSP